jgi:hypothetical protein
MSLIRLYCEIVPSAIGVFLLCLAFRNSWRGRASRQWSRTPSLITRSFVLVNTDNDGGFTYMPQIEYEYTVDGVAYRGTVLRNGQIGSGNRAQAEKVIAPYPEGASITSFYDASRPQTSVLVQGTSWGNLAIAAAGLAFLACGLAMMRF